ncbi:MAG: 50S ribosomal protein L2 [Bacteroidales bacterium]|uniref:50S ribosomal protein L2 n=1 Tax=Candidatus Cryptobacteroides sp. TaxID=2952915 RepID=UPI002A74AB9E|nr:50S ribosomal protein L2 [Candidatus Cryptobacteroides sp.]MBS7277197.1 50S ribosomal protein L2 [Bacteroidales bacterium]MDD5914314.1 50S ribosomal protein L2 [Bacteroidales bacterium]MDD7134898.1 50S ribosomal protein L2 [Bacteroidales bacterium]MDD7235351.1 50S ribosomal protein L2 [Bacteroidales bacterium]MDD7623560.1 50S ribosomal protein L2 [Bacteroidales bacterium]
MAIRKFKPMTPGTRNMAISAFDEITAKRPHKALLEPLKRTGGRNNTGQMTMRYIGGGHKKMYRVIDFLRNKDNVKATVLTVEYDPNRSARISLVEYADGEKRYIIAPAGIKVGQVIESGHGVSPDLGNCLPLAEIPVGTLVHNIELRPGQGAAMARSAGTFAQLAAREGNYAILRLPSGETRMVLTTCRAVVGTVSNADHNLESHGKAGRRRWLGRRPHNRGVVMNPVDHPMGGGEGRASGGHPRSRKGLPAKGYKTRNPKATSNRFIIERRKKK